ncbi:MAG: hypothetical protein JWM27_4723 [Gemmatimonadetes bacterium]|nr:hypothetical protein [Gemmatimonadota bacterium]
MRRYFPSTERTAPAPAAAKAISLSPAMAAFIPLDGSGRTLELSTASLAWYRIAWLVYACMRYRATRFAEAPLWIVDETDAGDQWLKGDHVLAGVLEQPNPDMEMADLLEVTSLYLDATGACLWVANRDRAGRIASAYPYSANDFQVTSAGGRIFGRYRVNTSTGSRVFEGDSLADVTHFREVDPSDPWGAVSPLDAAAARLGIDRALTESIRAGIRNAVVPGLHVGFPTALAPDQRAEYRATMEAGSAGATRMGKPLVTEGGAVATQFRVGFAGLEGGELHKETEAAVCACFQVPPAIIGAYVGLANSSDRHNMESAREMVYENAIAPRWARVQKTLTRAWLRPAEPTKPRRFIRFDTSGIKALQKDVVEAADVVSKAGRAMRVNDARLLIGMEPLPDARGEAMLGAALSPTAAPPPEVAPPPTKAARGPAEAKSEDMRWALFDADTSAQEYGWQAAASAEMARQRAHVLALAGEVLRTAAKEDMVRPVDAESVAELIRRVEAEAPFSEGWRRALLPLIEASGKRAAERAAGDIGIAFDLLQPGLVAYVEAHAAELAKELSATTVDTVRRELSAGLEAGEGIPALAKRLESSSAFAPSRAELIARTETTRVTNGAAHDSLHTYASDLGVSVSKTWLSAKDARVRDAHRAPLDGETKPVGVVFSNGLQFPGEPNCRCTLTYALVEDGA